MWAQRLGLEALAALEVTLQEADPQCLAPGGKRRDQEAMSQWGGGSPRLRSGSSSGCPGLLGQRWLLGR